MRPPSNLFTTFNAALKMFPKLAYKAVPREDLQNNEDPLLPSTPDSKEEQLLFEIAERPSCRQRKLVTLNIALFAFSMAMVAWSSKILSRRNPRNQCIRETNNFCKNTRFPFNQSSENLMLTILQLP